jgi:FAD/FMN-containing dehydrogenase
MNRRNVAGALASVGVMMAAHKACGGTAVGLDRLRARLSGSLVTPGQPDYERLRRVAAFNPETDVDPLAIARCVDVDDVRRCLDYALTSGLDVAVRGGGHDVLGASTTPAGLVIDLAPMAGVAIDPARRFVRLGAGALSGAVMRTAGAHGLAPVLGCNPSVGVAGLTLGGGLGWLLGTEGAACDHLVGADIVTATGRLLRVDAEKRPDLFWALRGGGGNFGIVTSLDLRLADVSQALAGAIGVPVEPPGALAALLRVYRDVMASAPDELALELNIAATPAPTATVLVCWTGDTGRGDRLLAPLRRLGPPRFDTLALGPFGRLAAGGALPPHLFWRGGSLDALGDEAIDALATAVQGAPPGWNLGLGHVMHGQIVRADPAATPLVRRAGQMSYFVGAGWPAAGSGDAGMSWVRATMAALRPHSSPATYVNYLSDDREAAVRAAYGPNYDRLRALKRRYDPGNVFRHNRNIRP